MSNRQLKNGIVVLMAGLLLGLSLGCESGGRTIKWKNSLADEIPLD